MAAGLGFKTFTTGEVLTAADTNGYLMQGVLVFASSAARASAITSPQEGQYSYLKDTNSTEYYDGAAWTAAATGDVTGVTAGTGILVASPTGPVPTVSIDTAVTVDKTTAQTLTNKTLTSPALTTPTISTLTTNGDLLYGTGSGALSRLGIGSTSQVLTVTGGVPVWATPAGGGGGKVLQVVMGTTTTTVTSATNTYVDTGLTATITPTLATSKVLVMVTQNGCGKGNGSASNQLGIKTFRGATQLSITTDMGFSNTAIYMLGLSYALNYLDSPATTSATTYKTQMASNANTSLVYTQSDNNTSTIVLMEIGA